MIVIHHHPCWDGLAAAWAVQKAAESDAIPGITHGNLSFYEGRYSEALPEKLVRGEDVVLVDFSYPRADLVRLGQIAKNVTMLDHHKTALAQAKDLKSINFMYSDAHSGAWMAWNYFHGEGTGLPLVCRYIEDHDLWQFRMEGSRAVRAVLWSYPLEFETLEIVEERLRHDLEGVIREGTALLRKQGAQERAICDRSYEAIFDEALTAVVNTPVLQSEVTQLLLDNDGYRFSVAWHVIPSGQVRVRLTGDGVYNVAKLAEKFGGGGHHNAAGFTLDGVEDIPWEMVVPVDPDELPEDPEKDDDEK